MPLPAISQRLLVNQSVPADAIQPLFALVQDGINGAKVPDALVGVAAVNCEKLGLLETSHHVRWSDGVTSGEVVIEVADEVNYTGAWSLVATVTYGGLTTTSSIPAAPSGLPTKQDYVRIQGSYGAYRHRITQAVVGGTVTTKIVGST